MTDNMVSRNATYSIGDLAREFDLTTRTIRFYEDVGLLQPVRQGTGGRVRVYSPRDRARLKLILRAKRLGFSLSEARQIIEMYDSPRDTEAQMRAYLEALATHRLRLEMQLAELQANLMEVPRRTGTAGLAPDAGWRTGAGVTVRTRTHAIHGNGAWRSLCFAHAIQQQGRKLQ